MVTKLQSPQGKRAKSDLLLALCISACLAASLQRSPASLTRGDRRDVVQAFTQTNSGFRGQIKYSSCLGARESVDNSARNKLK